MTGLLCVEYRAGANGTDARKRMRRGASNGFGFAGRVLPQRFVGEGVEFACPNVLLDLAIPDRPVKRQKPVPKLCKFLRGKSLDLVLKSFNFAHDTSLALPLKRRLTLPLSGVASPGVPALRHRRRLPVDAPPHPITACPTKRKATSTPTACSAAPHLSTLDGSRRSAHRRSPLRKRP